MEHEDVFFFYVFCSDKMNYIMQKCDSTDENSNLQEAHRCSKVCCCSLYCQKRCLIWMTSFFSKGLPVKQFQSSLLPYLLSSCSYLKIQNKQHSVYLSFFLFCRVTFFSRSVITVCLSNLTRLLVVVLLLSPGISVISSSNHSQRMFFLYCYG